MLSSRPVAAELAEEHTGLPAKDLRFESVTPVSAAAGAQWARTASFICRELITSGITEISPLVAHTLTRLVAAGAIRPLISERLTLADVPDGLRRLAAGATIGRVVFQP